MMGLGIAFLVLLALAGAAGGGGAKPIPGIPPRAGAGAPPRRTSCMATNTTT